jgi:hypothetical protein
MLTSILLSTLEGIAMDAMEAPRLLRPVGPPLGVYLRPGRNDHRAVLEFIGERPDALSGVILGACLETRQQELRAEAGDAGVETILDPRSVELATPVGFDKQGLAELPWAADAPDTPKSLMPRAGAMAESISAFVAEKRFSAVLAPTHYLERSEDPWLTVDAALTRALRGELDAAGRAEAPIYYPLVIHASLFRDAVERARIATFLQGLPIDAVWLRVHPFGSGSGPLALRRYIEACRDFHRLGVPVIGERTGTIGVALLAFGAVGGIESGVTLGERFDVRPLFRSSSSKDPFLPPPRVYVADIGAFLPRSQAEAFFENRQMKIAFGCRDSSCCRRGTGDTLRDPRRHFMIQRVSEVRGLSNAPETLRAQLYLDDFLRPATDLALRASRVEPALEPTRKRLEGWRQTLGEMAKVGPTTSFAAVPQGHRIPQRKRA